MLNMSSSSILSYCSNKLRSLDRSGKKAPPPPPKKKVAWACTNKKHMIIGSIPSILVRGGSYSTGINTNKHQV